MNRLFRISATAAFSATAVVSIFAWRHISTLDTRTISCSNSIPESLTTSQSVKTITNPNDHVSLGDTRSIIVRVPTGLTDEAILARFVTGFFSGYNFAPERMVLSRIQGDLVKFHALQNRSKPSRIYCLGALNDCTLPQVYTILFGAFQMADCSIAPITVTPREEGTKSKPTSSYIDIVYGQDGARLAGVHRFEVLRAPTRDEGSVEIRFSSTSCNAKEDVPINALLGSFHRAYAILLFKEGVLRVLQQSRD